MLKAIKGAICNGLKRISEQTVKKEVVRNGVKYTVIDKGTEEFNKEAVKNFNNMVEKYAAQHEASLSKKTVTKSE